MATKLPIQRFRFHGIRKLNWAERDWRLDYSTRMAEAGLDRWIEPGPLLIVIGPNGGGKTTVIDLLRSLADASVCPSLQRENYGGDDFSSFDVEGQSFEMSTRFSRFTPNLPDTFDFFTAFAVVTRQGLQSGFKPVVPKYASDGEWRAELQSLLDEGVAVKTCYRTATGPLPADELDDATLVALLNELSGHFPSVMANPRIVIALEIYLDSLLLRYCIAAHETLSRSRDKRMTRL